MISAGFQHFSQMCSFSAYFSAKINPQQPFHVYNGPKFSKQPFKILREEPLSRDFPQQIAEKPAFSQETLVKAMPEPRDFQKIALQLSFLKQQSANSSKYCTFATFPATFAGNELGFSCFSQEREKFLSNLALPDTVLRKMSGNALNNARFFDKTNRNYKSPVSKSPELRAFARKTSRKDANLSADGGISQEDALSEEESKENRPIFDKNHLPSPNSRKIINYDDLKMYNQKDECIEFEEKDNISAKSFASKAFDV